MLSVMEAMREFSTDLRHDIISLSFLKNYSGYFVEGRPR